MNDAQDFPRSKRTGVPEGKGCAKVGEMGGQGGRWEQQAPEGKEGSAEDGVEVVENEG